MNSKPAWGAPAPRAGQLPSSDMSILDLLRKLIAIRLKAMVRLLRHRSVRRKAAMSLATALLVLCTIHLVLRLPPAAHGPASHAVGGAGGGLPESVRRLGGRSSASFQDGRDAGGADAAAAAAAVSGLGGGDLDAALSEVPGAIVDELRRRGEGEKGYAEQLRRRALELNVEISKIKERAAPATKQKRLQLAAHVLSTQLAALKERSNELGPGEGAPPHAGAAAKGEASAGRRGGGDGPGGGESRGGGGNLVGAAAGAAAAGPCGRRHPEFRIAMILPWISSSADAASRHTPAWFPHLAATAAHSAMLVDWVVLHEGSLSLPAAVRAPNVKLVDLGSNGVARLFASRLGSALGFGAEEARALEQRMVLMFDKWPRLVAEYKPAYGEVFERWLGNYTHWCAALHVEYVFTYS